MSETIPYRDGIISDEWLAAVENGDCTPTDGRALVGLLRKQQCDLRAAEERAEDWHRVADARSKEIIRLSELLANAEAKLAECREDAERYRWLRARWDAQTDEELEQHTDAMNAEDPDAAIDAARRKEGKPKGAFIAKDGKTQIEITIGEQGVESDLYRPENKNAPDR